MEKYRLPRYAAAFRGPVLCLRPPDRELKARTVAFFYESSTAQPEYSSERNAPSYKSESRSHDAGTAKERSLK